ncbi:cbb3-type cytochrome c oxidase subunit 3 [Dichotomicrobium thermohalophilum]|uniref:Cytochrome c oxidase cbb3-type subunit 4 n=1 Tax=Dichotomicrobium thermohalophilum TaxID=933063 RepID=A0A397PIT8_9HYPH|nr:cbb3-type cytochrome c oxidase subunit 3 [Dichotomicrobium thermohalophilum]RIA47809.1 cytochrome c oxidase cbb3-type subunit 4 [Dichotomicrobium thermohalophilum]
MTYDTVVMVTQIVGLILFIGLFVAVLIYALWPGNKKRFERASRVPLEQDEKPDEDTQRGGDGG